MIISVREQIRSMLQVEAREGGFRALFNVGADLTVLPDHFRDGPILPGLCMVQAVLLAAAAAQGMADLRLRRLKTAKMMAPVFPGEQIVIEAEIAPGPDGDIIIKAKFFGSERKRAEFSLVAWPEPVLSAVEGPVLSAVEGPVLSAVEGPVLSAVEGEASP